MFEACVIILLLCLVFPAIRRALAVMFWFTLVVAVFGGVGLLAGNH